MRKYFVYCSLGLFSISWLTGCGCIRNMRGEGDDSGTHRIGLLQQRAPGMLTAKGSAGSVSTLTVPEAIVGQESVELIAPGQPDTTVQVEHQPAPTLPPPLPKITSSAEPPLSGKIEIVALPDAPAAPQPTANPLPIPATFVSNTAATTLPIPASFVPPDVTIVSSFRPVEPEPVNAKEKTVAIRSTQIHYGHAEHFTSITGQVQEYRKTFRLRYAAIDQEDTYGGVVILIGDDLRRLSDGRHVRIRGELIPPTDRNGMAHYRVAAIEVLD